jgi:flagellar biosynthesis protein
MEDSEHAHHARKKAVALRYSSESDQAPKVVAKGSGFIADQIIRLADEHDIHIHENPDMVEILSKLELNTEIPESLFRAVAEVLAFIYEMNRSMKLPE